MAGIIMPPSAERTKRPPSYPPPKSALTVPGGPKKPRRRSLASLFVHHFLTIALVVSSLLVTYQIRLHGDEEVWGSMDEITGGAGGAIRREWKKRRAVRAHAGLGMGAGALAIDRGNTVVSSGDEKCGVWLAETTGIGGGIGVFAGRDYPEGTYVAPESEGDVVVPYFDLEWHQGSGFFPWSKYEWDGVSTGTGHEADVVGVASPGYGSLLGCHDSISNVVALLPNEYAQGRDGGDSGGSSTLRPPRADNPSLGSWSVYFRGMATDAEVKEGEELFGPSPRCGRMRWTDKLGGDPEGGNRRDVDWLKRRGTCADNIRGSSTMTLSGRGAAANRWISRGAVVAPVPLVHIPDREVLNMYGGEDGTPKSERKLLGHQMLLNYCYGHPETTVLLCPFGHATSLVNHDKSLANVRLRWADPSKGLHHPEYLQKSVVGLTVQKTPVLAFEMVAKRDIEEGEEIYMDYGDAWQAAWDVHVRGWTLSEKESKYKPAMELNLGPKRLALLKKRKVPKHVLLMGDYASFEDEAKWRAHRAKHGNLNSFVTESTGFECKIVRWFTDTDGIALFTAQFFEGSMKMVNAPEEAFEFVDRPYTSDLHLRSGFRHEIMIPDSLLPDAWKNL